MSRPGTRNDRHVFVTLHEVLYLSCGDEEKIVEQQAKLIVQLTQNLGRQDGFTRLLNELNSMLTGVFTIPFIIIVPLTTLTSGMLSIFSTGLWSIVIDIV